MQENAPFKHIRTTSRPITQPSVARHSSHDGLSPPLWEGNGYAGNVFAKSACYGITDSEPYDKERAVSSSRSVLLTTHESRACSRCWQEA